MNCSNPIAIKFKPNKDTGKVKFVQNPITKEWFNGALVPCGKCLNCRIQKSKEWALRCVLELPYWDNAIFCTLTYNDENLPPNGSLMKKDLQLFFKRLRRSLEPLEIKYFASGEYGEGNLLLPRPHYHCIIFGIGLNTSDYDETLKCYRSFNRCVENAWTYGNVFNGVVTYNSARYTAEYVFKKYSGKLKEQEYLSTGREVPFQVQSNGIGLNFFNEWSWLLFKRGYITFQGVNHALPRYFSDKLKNLDEIAFNSVKNQNIVNDFDKWYKDYISFLARELQTDAKRLESDLIDNPLLFFDKKCMEDSIKAIVKEKHNFKRSEVFKR